MKRIFTILFSLSLMITSVSNAFATPVYAASEDTAAEVSTEKQSANLLLPENSPAESQSKEVPAYTGAAYGLDGMSGSPDVTAESAIVMDARSGEIIYAKQADTKRYPASITKVMTTLIAIEQCNMDDIVEFTNEAVYGVEAGSSSAGINVGAMLTVEETLYALMLVSANEAGAAIAEHISGSSEEFGKLMTERAAELGCTNTNFKNPHGLPDEEHYTSAYDMGLIMKEAIKHEEFRKIAGTIHYTIENNTLPQPIDLWNHAKILRDSTDYYYKYAKGAKTGFTRAALNTLVTYAEKDGVQLLCVILKDYGADQSYYDTKHLYKWAFDQVKSIQPLSNFDLNLAISSMDNLSDKEVEKYQSLNGQFDRTFPVCVKKDFDENNIVGVFRFDEDIQAGRLGMIDVKCGEDLIYSTPVLYDVNSDAARNYQVEKGGGDQVKTVNPKNKDSLLDRIMHYLLRIGIACLLIFVIMQIIHRWQLANERKKRIRERQARVAAARSNGKAPTQRKPQAKKGRPTSSGRSNSSSASRNTGNRNSNRSSDRNSSSTVVRHRRHK